MKIGNREISNYALGAAAALSITAYLSTRHFRLGRVTGVGLVTAPWIGVALCSLDANRKASRAPASSRNTSGKDVGTERPGPDASGKRQETPRSQALDQIRASCNYDRWVVFRNDFHLSTGKLREKLAELVTGFQEGSNILVVTADKRLTLSQEPKYFYEACANLCQAVKRLDRVRAQPISQSDQLLIVQQLIIIKSATESKKWLNQFESTTWEQPDVLSDDSVVVRLKDAEIKVSDALSRLKFS